MDASAIYSHPNQVWVTEPSPQDMSLIITSSLSSNSSKAVTLWKMPRQSESEFEIESSIRGGNFGRDPLELEKVTSFNLKDPSTFVHSIKWHAVRDSVLTVDPKLLVSWSIGEASAQVFHALLHKINACYKSKSQVFKYFFPYYFNNI